jgi:hypothetical protein
LGVAALAVVVGIAAAPGQDASVKAAQTAGMSAAPAVAAAAAPAALAPAQVAPPAAAPAEAPSTATAPAEPAPAPAPAPPPPPPALALNHESMLQQNGFFCGPNATRVALTAFNIFIGPDDLAARLGTTPGGTDSAFDITRVLNGFLGADRYKTTEMAGKVATPEQIAQLKADIVAAINQGKPVVANIAGTVHDTIGEVHSYPGGHYLTVFGYSEDGEHASIADSADRAGSPEYQVSVADLAQWIASRGYSS